MGGACEEVEDEVVVVEEEDVKEGEATLWNPVALEICFARAS